MALAPHMDRCHRAPRHKANAHDNPKASNPPPHPLLSGRSRLLFAFRSSIACSCRCCARDGVRCRAPGDGAKAVCSRQGHLGEQAGQPLSAAAVAGGGCRGRRAQSARRALRSAPFFVVVPPLAACRSAALQNAAVRLRAVNCRDRRHSANLTTLQFPMRTQAADESTGTAGKRVRERTGAQTQCCAHCAASLAPPPFCAAFAPHSSSFF